MSGNRDLALLMGALAVFAWASLPPESIAIGPSCHARGVQAEISATLYGSRFWRAQRQALTQERDRLVAQMVHADDGANGGDQVSGIEARMSRLTDAKASPADDDERQRLESAAQRSRLDRLAWLNNCETAMARRLAD